MIINGKEVKLRLDFGAIKMINKQIGKNFLALTGDDFADPEIISALIYSCALRGGSEVDMDDIDSMTMNELVAAQEELNQLMKDFAPEVEGGPLAKKRRK